MRVVLFALLIVSVISVNIGYDVTCSTGPDRCGSGGKYTFTQTTPTAGGPLGNPDISCTVGDTITFNFPTALPGHPFDIQTSGGASFPGAGGSYPYTGSSTVSFNCDATLASQGPAIYICTFHSSMTGRITAVVAGQPTAAPTNGTGGGSNISSSLTVPVDVTGYTQIDLGKDMFFYFRPLTGTGDQFLDFAIQAPTAGGWVGVGFSRDDNFQMKGSDAFIGSVSPDGAGASLNGYVLTQKVIEGILVNPNFRYYGASASLVNGVTILAIRRKLNEGLNPILVNENGQLNSLIIASYSNDPSGEVNFKHDVRIEFGRYVNLVTGQVATAYRYALPVRVAHGVLMGTAYALLFPLGLMTARYGKSESGTWFKVHFFLQNYGIVFHFSLFFFFFHSYSSVIFYLTQTTNFFSFYYYVSWYYYWVYFT
jgi:hypothetical protein